ncbi:MAG: hypothetical protein KF891_02340 [Rhizobacter sp.]|nr:hypothetical protein [Rhizobacter sp.]
MKRLLISLVLAAGLPACAQPTAAVSAGADKVTLERVDKSFKAKLMQPNGSSALVLVADPKLQSAMKSAEQYIVLGHQAFELEGKQFVVLAIAVPSTTTNGQGYCGAGTEDHLLLVEMQIKLHRLALRDDMLVQSCLKSMTLQSDRGSDLTAVLGTTSPHPLQLTWLTHPTYEGQTKTYRVAQGKWVMQN